jgi:hypothetical protein
MTDRPLTTRDLADREDPTEADGPSESEEHGDDEAVDDTADVRSDRGADSGDSGSDREPLVPSDQSDRFTTRWEEIQASFVDQPREAVEQADALVADLMQRLAASFSDERERLETQWDRGDDVSTEDLRVALTRYRSFFARLLSA